jgi:hypothetical protein
VIPLPLTEPLLRRSGIGERRDEWRVDQGAAGRNSQLGDTAATVGSVRISVGELPGAGPLRIPICEQALGAGLGERVRVRRHRDNGKFEQFLLVKIDLKATVRIFREGIVDRSDASKSIP